LTFSSTEKKIFVVNIKKSNLAELILAVPEKNQKWREEILEAEDKLYFWREETFSETTKSAKKFFPLKYLLLR